MTDPFATPDPQAPQEPTPVYDSANPAGSAPQAPQPNEPAPVLYGECFASMSFQQAHQYFSAVWADGFPRSRHHAVSDVR